MSLRDVIARHGSPYTVTRLTAGSHDANGHWTAGTSSTIPIVAFIEPVDGRELEDVPEGQRGNEIRRVFTETALRAGAHADTIAVDGETWVVIKSPRFVGLGGAHDVALIARTVTP